MADVQPDAPVFLAAGQEAMTYAGLAEVMDGLASTLLAAGIGRGKRVGLIHSGGADQEWRDVSGKGRLYAWTEVHVPVRGLEDFAPYVLAAVELDEGVRVMSRLINVTAAELTPGMVVQVAWEKLSDEISLYVFEPASA